MARVHHCTWRAASQHITNHLFSSEVMMTTPLVIFACVQNAGRSQMAAAWFAQLADPRKVRASSAGTKPAAHVHPEVLSAMREVDIDLLYAKPQRLTDAAAAGANILITMGCGEACPTVTNVRREDWPLEDPKEQPIERVREIRDDIRARVVALLAREGWGR
jgi:arsenate reductase (thioredoxin)